MTFSILEEQLIEGINHLISTSFFAATKLEVSIFDHKISFDLEAISSISLLPALYSGKSVLEKLTFEDFYFIFLSIFHEKSIVFVSESRKLLSQSMYLDY